MKDERISYETIAVRLERVLHADVGMKGLKTLLYGWRKHPGFHAPNASSLTMRASKASAGYLTLLELIDFSRYAGYNLTR